MNAISAFFMQNIVYVYFFYGLAFCAMGLVVLLESGRTSEFRFARALLPLALFGLLHGAHEWFEMFQIFAAHEGGVEAGLTEEVVRVALLVASFLFLLGFGTRLLPRAEAHPRASLWQVAVLGGIWLAGIGIVYLRFRPVGTELMVSADVLARYSLAIPGALLAAWALLRERRDFHARGMSRYGQGLLWAALAFFVYGVIGQAFTRPSLVWPSQTFNTALFLRTFGIPVQLLRGLAAVAIAITLAGALRAFEQEGRVRLARANKARLEAQAATLEAQQRRADEVEALNLQLQATAQELSSMVEMSRILTSTVDMSRLLQDALDQIVHSFEGTSASVISLKQSDGHLKLAGIYRHPNASEANTLPELLAVASKAVDSGLAVGARWDGQLSPLGAEAFAADRSYRTLGVPLRAKEHTLGGLALSSLWEETPLRAEELNLLHAFAQQVATSLENVQLYQMLQEREAQLEDLVRQLVNTQEGERQRIARELHDETGQKLTALAMGLAAVETNLGSDEVRGAVGLVRNLRGLADQAIAELRNIMANLRPSQLDDLGLVPTLRWYVQQFAERHPGLQVDLSADRLAQRLPPDHETVLFRVVQEALSNVARHARATQVTVKLTVQEQAACLEISDNGVGFDVSALSTPDALARAGGGWGLVGMRERVALVGGQFTIRSRLGQGTHVMVDLPSGDAPVLPAPRPAWPPGRGGRTAQPGRAETDSGSARKSSPPTVTPGEGAGLRKTGA